MVFLPEVVYLLQFQQTNTASSVHVFKEVYQRTNFSLITYKASSGMEGERMHVVFFG